jgi:hypothetical protein
VNGDVQNCNCGIHHATFAAGEMESQLEVCLGIGKLPSREQTQGKQDQDCSGFRA